MQHLRARLTKAGFSDVSFRIILSKPSKNDTGKLDILRSYVKDIPVIQESEKIHSTWKSILESEVDHILVLDRCGQLAFQVISPWSLLNHPYVKAAILSTYNDDPCGPCNYTKNEDEASLMENSTTVETDSVTPQIQTIPEAIPTVEDEIKDDYNVTDTTPSYSNNSQPEPITLEHDNNGKTSVEMQENSTENSVDTPVHNTQNTEDLLQYDSSQENLVNNEKTEQKSMDSSVTEQTLDNTFKNNLQDISLEENELDATLSPLEGKKDGNVPIRVIMHSPHSHIRNGTVTKYEYLVLQTGNPQYHGHVESEENQDLVVPEDVKKIHLSQKSKKLTGKKYHSTKPIKSDEKGKIAGHATVEDHKHKGYKNHKKIKQNESEEIKDKKSNEESSEIKNHKGKIQRPYSETNYEESEERIVEVKNSKGKNLQNKVNMPTAGLKESGEIIEDKIDKIALQHYSSIMDTQETLETSSTEHDDKSKEQHNSEIPNINDEDSSDSHISQNIRKHGKHHHHHDSESTNHNINMINTFKNQTDTITNIKQ
ncbi:hypothetical protein L9F63_024227 [Diploptera punctata]|uniref:Selenoprotein P N-terminal domain-containing protein n=1 Tax=Diploptera punctata TaxID=6984 RepID=A0AAD7ZHV4_DIPPU|nr:hypothetical protein L9F63_024227 [Diploptera punctata]